MNHLYVAQVMVYVFCVEFAENGFPKPFALDVESRSTSGNLAQRFRVLDCEHIHILHCDRHNYRVHCVIHFKFVKCDLLENLGHVHIQKVPNVVLSLSHKYSEQVGYHSGCVRFQNGCSRLGYSCWMSQLFLGKYEHVFSLSSISESQRLHFDCA